MRYAFLLGAPLVALAASCTEPKCLDICSVWAEVRGTVRVASGAPVVGATIDLALMREDRAAGGESTCRHDTGAAVASAVTAADGKYSSRLHSISIAPADCIELTVTPPPGVDAATVVDTVRVSGWSLREDTAPVTEASVVLPPGSS